MEQTPQNSAENPRMIIKDDGDLIKVFNSSPKLALKICEALGQRISEAEKVDLIENLITGETLRPGGAFAVGYDATKGEVVIDNRNGRGYQPNRDQMKTAVENCL